MNERNIKIKVKDMEFKKGGKGVGFLRKYQKFYIFEITFKRKICLNYSNQFFLYLDGIKKY